MPPGGQSTMNNGELPSDKHQTGPACITCREKCRKCDRTKPVCQRCISKGLECKGYPEKFRFAGLATRGKWKNRAVPSEARGHRVQSRAGVEATDPQLQEQSLKHDQQTEVSQPSSVQTWPRSEEERSVELDDLLMLERTEALLAYYPRRLCFSSELREAIVNLSDLKFERVNGCPRALFLVMGKAMEHAKAHALGNMSDSDFQGSLSSCQVELNAWHLPTDGYPDDNTRWPAVAEAFRHACILHTSRLMDMRQPAEAHTIQHSVTAILDAVAEIPAECRLIELLVMPLFMAGADALSSYARHYVLLRFDHVKNHGGLGNQMPISLLKSVWEGRGRQSRHDRSNVYWVWFTHKSASEPLHDYLII
ncbi:hypothetical protein N7541_006307 [Penicillium brevicompactum]|uniref:Zn(2)-C6 fungal-type domain-containing protein n=1 Tax=Penicillium brevicompactum TaxID=5074 RepID=A0A9W9RA95_PENBR|nr:hypothetical protein N7541_006307 [Penicillium brevicompactum]